MPHSVASDLGLHCFLWHVCLNTQSKYGIAIQAFFFFFFCILSPSILYLLTNGKFPGHCNTIVFLTVMNFTVVLYDTYSEDIFFFIFYIQRERNKLQDEKLYFRTSGPCNVIGNFQGYTLDRKRFHPADSEDR